MLDDKPTAIIVLDLDYFYAQVEEVIDMTECLRKSPVAVRQKQVVVTCNYLARAAGVSKLMLLNEAIKKCPNLIVINGEDTSSYRASSKHIRQLLEDILSIDAIKSRKSLVKLQRVGLDEFYIDVTELISSHLREVRDYRTLTWPTGEVFFKMPGGSMVASQFSSVGGVFPLGFLYQPNRIDGNIIGCFTEYESQKSKFLLIASHIANHLRLCLKKILGFSSSCGIGSNKLIAKLASNVKKPDNQSTVSHDVKTIQAFVGEMDLHCITGFGFSAPSDSDNFQWITSSDLMNINISDDEFFSFISNENTKIFKNTENSSIVIRDDQICRFKITVKKVLEISTSENFLCWFGSDLGSKYWLLLHGEDSSDVIPSKDPATISIEDSFPGCLSMAEVEDKLLDLADLFIQRLFEEEFELNIPLISESPMSPWLLGTKAGKDMFNIVLTKQTEKKQLFGKQIGQNPEMKHKIALNKSNDSIKKGSWKRHPKLIILTIRRRNIALCTYESRKTVMPVEIFYNNDSTKSKARILLNTLTLLFKQLMIINDQDTVNSELKQLNMFRISASDFVLGQPDRIISSYFVFKSHGSGNQYDSEVFLVKKKKLATSPLNGIDLEVWNELPKEIQTELRIQYFTTKKRTPKSTGLEKSQDHQKKSKSGFSESIMIKNWLNK
ncbi:hypothetical protein HK096_003728 [Nowakowskiella sp. JEL0078]|nr:hypothetical protein HK096_003728 [Nowakowskiella sp. JEL0078]